MYKMSPERLVISDNKGASQDDKRHVKKKKKSTQAQPEFEFYLQ